MGNMAKIRPMTTWNERTFPMIETSSHPILLKLEASGNRLNCADSPNQPQTSIPQFYIIYIICICMYKVKSKLSNIISDCFQLIACFAFGILTFHVHSRINLSNNLCKRGAVIVASQNKAHEAYMGPTWGRQDQGEPHIGPMNLATRGLSKLCNVCWVVKIVGRQ